ncbi:SDR family oxidoreductase, partial [bacterium]|nr:SDR family oxidoreductase [bacterium]
PDVIIHSAAIRDPDACEREPDAAFALHAGAAEAMARWAERRNALLVYISTDLVFDGLHPPYHEGDVPSPLSVYGASKAAGESAVSTLSRHLIVRIPLQYGYFAADDDSFLIKAIRRINAGGIIELDDTQIRYPTLSDDVASALAALIPSGVTGIVHLSGPTRMTRYSMFTEIAGVFGCTHAVLAPVSSAGNTFAGGQIARRPHDSHLATSRYDSLGLPAVHSFREGLELVRSSLMP